MIPRGSIGDRSDAGPAADARGADGIDAEGMVFLGPGAFEIAPYRVDPPGPGEVRVRMAASGICHSDLHVLDGHWTRPAPLVMGHEGAGWVEAVGPSGPEDGPRVGDLVVLAWTAPCARCAACRRGEGWLCAAPAGFGHRLAANEIRIRRPDGSALGAYSGIGTLGSVQVVAAAAAIRIDPRTDPAVAALVGCAITTGVGAVTRTARVQPGETVAVVGLGGVGLATVLGARLAGAGRVVAIDSRPEKLERARELGASDMLVAAASAGVTGGAIRGVLARGPHAARTTGATDGADGVDHAFEASGTVQGAETALAAVRPGGTVTFVGMPAQAARLGLDVYSFVESGARILASNYGSAIPAEIFPELAGRAVDGSLPLERLIEERIALRDAPAAFDALRRGDGVRRVVVFPASKSEASVA